MANATPIQFAGRGQGFYDESKGEDSGLHEVDLKRPESVTSRVAVRCKCGVKTFLVNGAESAVCPACGKTVKAKK
jgi:hypothetical protein